MTDDALLDFCAAGALSQNYRRTWSLEDLEFVRDNLGRLPVEEIALTIGRSSNAVKIIQVRRRIPAMSKRPGWLTGHQVSKILSVDIHPVMAWVKRGILPAVILTGPRHIIHVRRVTLYRWAVNPEHWIYFRPHLVKDPHLRRLLELQRRRWNDEWWTPEQVARYWGLCDNRSVNMAIHRGRLKATRWWNWWIKRSDCLSYRLIPGKGNTTGTRTWSPRADAWILKARDQLGMQFIDIAPRMGPDWNAKKVGYRYRQLKALQHVEESESFVEV